MNIELEIQFLKSSDVLKFINIIGFYKWCDSYLDKDNIFISVKMINNI